MQARRVPLCDRNPEPFKECIMQNSSAFQYIAIDQIHESTTNPRLTFEQNKLEELAESIRQHGLIQPITVRPNSEGFEIVAGARRSASSSRRNSSACSHVRVFAERRTKSPFGRLPQIHFGQRHRFQLPSPARGQSDECRV
jgi:hypothetical protein